MNDQECANIERLKTVAETHGLHFNEDAARVEKVAGLMARNFKEMGEYVCPCKQKNRPAKKGEETLCPCPELDEEISSQGHCHCKLFFR